MPHQVLILLAAGGLMFLVIGCLAALSHYYTLSGIKSKTVGDGQHGTARWATKAEIKETYAQIPFTSEKWRSQAKQGNAPTMSLPTKKRRLLFRLLLPFVPHGARNLAFQGKRQQRGK